ncbi:MAG: DNA polymerase III subunit alpha [Xanthobacteraceae bacterium]|nr:DNA polymerase III subunit alpha [Xanthobacteraceae bacterium]
MAKSPFVHLHVHSSYSLLEGALSLARLAELASRDRQPALALTDTGNLFGALEFSEKMASAGVQPIVGCSLAVDFADEPPARAGAVPPPLPRIVLLAATEDGYRNLMTLTSRSFMESEDSAEPRVPVEWLSENAEGLIALTGGPAGPIDRVAVEKPELACARLEALKAIYGDRLYIELQRHSLTQERRAEPQLLAFSDSMQIPLVATNEPFFASRDDYEAQDALLAIAEGRRIAETDRRQLSPEHYLKSQKEMAELFADLPEAIAATAEIAQRCSYRPTARKPILPNFGGARTDETEELRRLAEEGLRRRMNAFGIAEGYSEAQYRERLEFELNVIAKMKYAGYFLIVADFIVWAKQQDIPVGPGRGSGAGSLVAYALTITDLDPIRFGLLFERFLNPERVSMPDFDIDFCQDRRDEVIRYVQERYGRDRVAQIITFGSLQARGVLRDVGRVLEMPYGQVDKLCKLVPVNPTSPVTLEKAIEGDPRLQQAAKEEPIVQRAFDIALKLEGLHRHASTHAAGIVIGDRPLGELIPLYRDPRSNMPVTQFNMKWVEVAGLVKFDFLGLKTLTVIRTATELLAKRGVEVDIDKIPLDDKKTFEMLARGETVGVFQVEGQGMRRALADMKPDRFEDIIALVALYRPGPMANIPTYCFRKLGKEKPEYIHPKLEPVLKETFGVIVYQEQVMEAARVLAGYSLGEADLLRRAMGKKIKKEMAAQQDRFVRGAVEQGIDKSQANSIFDLLAKFADYGFNKSHAAAYALVAYQTAYLKANYPVEFLAASMTLDMGNTDKLAEFRREAQRMKIHVEPPSINKSGRAFDVEGNTIFYSLAALKGVGGHAVDAMVAARGDRPFKDLTDFASRIDPKSLNKRMLESLAGAGAFDALEKNRARVFAGCEAILRHAQRSGEDRASGQSELFGGSSNTVALRLPDAEPWLPAERLSKEFDAAGFYLSGHPLDDYANALKRMRVQSWAEFQQSARAGQGAGKLAATIVSRQERRTKTGSRMANIRMSDATGYFEAVIFQEGLAQYQRDLEPGKNVLVQVGADVQGDEVRLRIGSVELLDQVAAKNQRGLVVTVRPDASIEQIAKRLQNGTNGNGNSKAEAKAETKGEVNIVVSLEEGLSEVEVKLPGKYPISPLVAGNVRAVEGVLEVQEL